MMQARYEINFIQRGIEIYFPTKPAEYLLNEMKQTGWRWHAQKRCWYSYNSTEHIKQARRICQESNDCSTVQTKNIKGSCNNITTWNEESVLHRNGYTVSQGGGLLAIERQRILNRVINKSILTPRQIIYHIETQIALREKNEKYEWACQKWKEDITYLKKKYAC